MSATLNQQNQQTTQQKNIDHNTLSQVKYRLPATLLPSHHITHPPASGVNPLVDSASYLFSLLGKIKQATSHRQLATLHTELQHELRVFEDQAQTRGYNQEYIIVCRYLMCAAFDDVISNTTWGSQGQWDDYSMLASFNQDTNHQEKFFAIMERAVKDPKQYIDLMEIMYLCLSLGYKGQYRGTEHTQYQLEQITNNLYQYIRNERGQVSKLLSPTAIKPFPTTQRTKILKQTSFAFIFLVTASIIMIIFISLSYLMDLISNEAYKDVFPGKITATAPYHASSTSS